MVMLMKLSYLLTWIYLLYSIVLICTKKKIEEVEQILDWRIGKRTRGRDYYEYLMKKNNRQVEDAK